MLEPVPAAVPVAFASAAVQFDVETWRLEQA